MTDRFVAYYRVSTTRQGVSGLGLEAQRRMVAEFLGSREMMGEFTEIESAKSDDNRPKLTEAMKQCQLTGAVLLIAKLDRLSRDLHFVTGLQKSNVRFVCCDMPEANELTIHIIGAVAQAERKAISERTKAALASIKAKLARGEVHVSRSGNVVTRLGNNGDNFQGRPDPAAIAVKVKADMFAVTVAPTIKTLRDAGYSLQVIADRLNEMHVRTPRRGQWAPMTVKRVLDRA